MYGQLINLLSEEFNASSTGLPLDYMALTSTIRIIPLVGPLLQQPLLIQPIPEKHVLSFQPVIQRKPASQMKEEMMARYAKDGYYFLEDYVDAMMEPSTCTLNTR
jgi:hypothetical protein